MTKHTFLDFMQLFECMTAEEYADWTLASTTFSNSATPTRRH